MGTNCRYCKAEFPEPVGHFCPKCGFRFNGKTEWDVNPVQIERYLKSIASSLVCIGSIALGGAIRDGCSEEFKEKTIDRLNFARTFALDPDEKGE